VPRTAGNLSQGSIGVSSSPEGARMFAGCDSREFVGASSMNSKSWKNISRICGISLALSLASPVFAGTFGKVISIGGHASDLALDEGRGVIYVANFGAGLIDVMSLSDYKIQRSINVGGQPGSVAMSPDGKYLVVAQYGNFEAPNSSTNALSVIDLTSGSKQTFAMGRPPLGVAFGIDGRAFLVTTTDFSLFDPATGQIEVLDTVAGLVAKTLPQPAATAPAQIVATSLANSGDGVYIYGVTDTFHFRYDSGRKFLRAGNYTATPPLGPRAVSVNRDGSSWMSGWTLNDPDFWVISQFPNVTGALNVGSVLIDSHRDRIYAQVQNAGGAAAAQTPVLFVADADNLTIRDRLVLQENLSGKSVLSSDGSTMYSVSESGVYILPVGEISREPRIVTSQQGLLFRGNFCDRSVATQEVNITSEGGPAAFTLTTDQAGIRMSPRSGVTPATVRVSVDPSTFQNQKGTVSAVINVASPDAVNQVTPIKVLINSREPDQRGTTVNVEGKLVDLIADPDRDRFFVLRQDTNEVLVYDGTTFTQIAALRTYNTPKSMTITFDRRWLLVGNEDSHLISVFDLETLQAERPIRVGDYVQSIAASTRAILAATRSASGGDNKIHKIDLASRTSTPLPTLGAFQNKIVPNTVVVASPNGRSILIAQADGNLMLYNAVQDTFTVSRKETTPLLGAYAASNFDQYVVGNALLNSSLVPMRRMETDSGRSSGFAFVDDRTAFRITAAATSAPGVMQRVDLANGSGSRPTRTIEAPLLATDTQAFTRTLAPLYSRTVVVALTTSGFTVLPWNYDSASAPPRIDRIVNAADFSQPVAPGGLVTVLGSDLSPVSQSSRQVPLPTALGESCLTVNGIPVPVMFVSPRQINAQLPFSVDGSTTLVLRTPSGVSDNFNVTIQTTAPSIFRNGVAGPQADVPTVVRANNNQVVTLSNPVHHGDVLTIYATGLGRTSPSVETGVPAPSDPPASALVSPVVTIGGVPVEVLFAGLSPGEVGIYQINVRVGGAVPPGLSVPLAITQGSIATEVPVRVVD
jgi:uncharacterized protein (TIGR03437 family)